jgi:hypothetical protein
VRGRIFVSVHDLLVEARRLPMADALGDNGHSAISTAVPISMKPGMVENEIVHPAISGLWETSGSIPVASYVVNFMAAIHASRSTRPHRTIALPMPSMLTTRSTPVRAHYFY